MNYVDAEGDIVLEADEQNGLIRLKAVATFDDPVDLTPDEARDLAQQLLRLADEVG
jgi:hypothetical protein